MRACGEMKFSGVKNECWLGETLLKHLVLISAFSPHLCDDATLLSCCCSVSQCCSKEAVAECGQQSVEVQHNGDAYPSHFWCVFVCVRW